MLISRTLILAGAVTGLLAQYDVVSVKPNSANDNRFMFRFGANLTGTGVTLKMLIMEAYNARVFQISGGPGWIGNERWDIQAKADNVQGRLPASQLRMMLQTLLEDRFQLKIHSEIKEMPVYALRVGKNGSKLTPHVDGPPQPGEGSRWGSFNFQRLSTAMLATKLSLQLGRIVIDRTNLKGEYDVTLEWAYEPGQGGLEALGLPADLEAPPAPDPNKPSILIAVQEQLGLRLDSEKGPVEIIVIDHVEKPSGN